MEEVVKLRVKLTGSVGTGSHGAGRGGRKSKNVGGGRGGVKKAKGADGESQSCAW